MEKQLTAEQRVDAELEHEMKRVRNALLDYAATCNECDFEMSARDVDYGECPECLGDDFTVLNDDGPSSPGEYIEHLLDLRPQYTVYRAQISTGGPGDQFDLYVDEDGEIVTIKYVFLPWFDRAERALFGQNFDDVKAIFESEIYCQHVEMRGQ